MDIIDDTNQVVWLYLFSSVQMESSSSIAIATINDCLTELKNRNQDTQLENMNLFSIIEKLTLTEINYILYRCNSEEKDDDTRSGAYVIPEFGELVYCGLQGRCYVIL